MTFIYMKSLCEFEHGKSFQEQMTTRLSVWDIGIFWLDGFWHGRPITSCACVHASWAHRFDWHAFVQSERCKPISNSIKKKMFFGVPNFERQAVDMNIKVGTFRVNFQVTFIMITTMILQTRMLTANSRSRDFQLIISLPINKGSFWNVPLC